jgi:nucleotide-binding universal stress UspA family protein
VDNILVAIDGSEHSNRVVDYACNLAKKISAKILLVYVMNPPPEPEAIEAFERSERYQDAYADYVKALGESVTQKFQERVEKQGLNCTVSMPSGNPAEEIMEIAQIEKPELIVIGLKGLHGLARFRSLGSISRRVLEHSELPVVVVP